MKTQRVPAGGRAATDTPMVRAGSLRGQQQQGAHDDEVGRAGDDVTAVQSGKQRAGCDRREGQAGQSQRLLGLMLAVEKPGEERVSASEVKEEKEEKRD